MSGELYRAIITDLDEIDLEVIVVRLADRIGWNVELTNPVLYGDLGKRSIIHLTPRQAVSLAAALTAAAGMCDLARLEDAAPGRGSTSSLVPGPDRS